MRIAILGGTFDPIHNGHLTAAQAVKDVFRADEVHFVPAFSPPHKPEREITSPFHRFAMVVLASISFKRFQVSTVEVDLLQKRYSVETLEAIGRMHPGSELLFIVGTDMYQEIETWRHYRRLINLAHVVIVNRPGFPFRKEVAPFRTLQKDEPITLPERSDAPRSVFYLPFVEQPISSTQIREDVRRGAEVRQWLPSLVWSYIEKNSLYS